MSKFFKAHFTGNIIEIARLINKTFGDELVFRTLGMMRGDDQTTPQMLEFLEKRRRLTKETSK